ncbi:MAG: peptidylprolyl isomerase [Deltaproteobacteria bacterium]|nr:peptidylprolyl isomerase [Kofleriaceae bacterium]
MMRPRLFLFAALVALLALAGTAVAQPKAKKARRAYIVDRVVAVVNDSVILDTELTVRMAPYEADVEGIEDPKERARRLEKLRGQVLDELVNEELIFQAAADAKIEVTAKEIDAAITDIRTNNKLDEKQFQQALVAQGYNITAYRADIQRQLTRVKAMNQLVAPKVNVTDDEVRARYDQMLRRSEAVSAVRLSHMLFALPERPSEPEVAAAKAKAAAAIARVKGGEDFAEVAAQVSEDGASKGGGGELGWIERGSLDPQWESVVFAMDKGEVRGPVSGPTGLHVFHVTEVKRNDMKTFDDLKEQIRGELRRREMDKQTQAWIEDLRKKAFIDVKL